MAAVTFDVQYTEPRNRLTTAFRAVLAIPHWIITGVWQYLAQILGVVQWFVVLFTGKRNQGMWNLQHQWMGYDARVTAYGGLLFDPWPPIGTDPGASGVTYDLAYEEPANRLTNGLRLIWAIPAIIITIGLAIAGVVVTVVSWFAILFTGSHPRGMFDFLVKVHRYARRTTAYLLLMTDTYPKYE